MSIPRDVLAAALGGNVRAIAAFEEQDRRIGAAEGAGAGATDAIRDASVIVLAPNAEFANERVLRLGPGLRMNDDGTYLTIEAGDDVPAVEGGHRVTLQAQGATLLILPVAGTLVTRGSVDTLSNKTLETPLIDVFEAADDAAAAAAGVPVNGVYRTGSALKVRVA